MSTNEVEQWAAQNPRMAKAVETFLVRNPLTDPDDLSKLIQEVLAWQVDTWNTYAMELSMQQEARRPWRRWLSR